MPKKWKQDRLEIHDTLNSKDFVANHPQKNYSKPEILNRNLHDVKWSPKSVGGTDPNSVELKKLHQGPT